ncbi:transposase, partial [Streptococcus gordonii]
MDEFFRSSLETAMNDLLQAELSAFLGYEHYDKVGYN